MKRFVAIAASVTMIVVAVIVRAAIDDDDGGGSSTRLTIACVSELEAECRTLSNVDLRIEDASVTAKAIAAGNANIDGWVTFDPWPDIAAQLGQSIRTEPFVSIASTPMQIAMVQERADAFAPSCGGSIMWKCLGDALGRPWTDVGGRADWGTVKAGLPSPSTALGLLLLGNATASYFGRTDFATNDFDADFLVWRSKVTATPATFDEFILKYPAAFSAVGTTKVTATSAGNRPVAAIAGAPAGTVTVVVTSYRGNNASRIAEPLGRRLMSEGWDQAAAATSTGLPDPGVLLALSGLTG